MKCPQDDTTLAMSDRQGIEIDYCPTCRGVWLDRGELDKLIERESRWLEDSVDEREAERARSAPDAKPGSAQEEKEGHLLPAGHHGDGPGVGGVLRSSGNTGIAVGSRQRSS